MTRAHGRLARSFPEFAHVREDGNRRGESSVGVEVADLHDCPYHDVRGQRVITTQATPFRRARSLSPSRKSPKLRHTNGRLHIEPVAAVQRRLGREVITSLPNESDGVRGCPDVQRGTPSSSSFPDRRDVRRSISCAGWSEARPSSPEGSFVDQPTPTPRRFKIFYRDEVLRENHTKNTRRMIENARSLCQSLRVLPATSAHPSALAPGPSDTSEPPIPLSNQQRFALKVLRYRKLIDRMHKIDDLQLSDPSFDVLECLGVQWCKV